MVAYVLFDKDAIGHIFSKSIAKMVDSAEVTVGQRVIHRTNRGSYKQGKCCLIKIKDIFLKFGTTSSVLELKLFKFSDSIHCNAFRTW